MRINDREIQIQSPFHRRSPPSGKGLRIKECNADKLNYLRGQARSKWDFGATCERSSWEKGEQRQLQY